MLVVVVAAAVVVVVAVVIVVVELLVADFLSLSLCIYIACAVFDCSFFAVDRIDN